MAKGNIEKEDILRAILVADDFDDVFSPFLRNGCSVLLPLASRRILEYSLEWLSRSGIQETVLFCSTKADAIKEFVRNSQWSRDGSCMKIVVMVSERCMSLGDALRDIDNKAIIKSDFVLLSTSCVANFPLEDVLKEHKNQCKKDRGNAMTMILQDRGCASKGEETFLAINSDTNRVLLYSKNSTDSKIQLSMECLGENPRLTLRSTLKDTGIAICSPSVPLLFSDNFDFQTKEDFIRGLLLNEEVLASSIYCHVTAGYGYTVQDWPSYQRVTKDVVHRWTYPFVPDAHFGGQEPLIHLKGCVYKHKTVNLSKGCNLDSDVVIGKNCSFGSNVRLIRSVVGAGCVIEDDVFISDSFILDNVIIKAGSQILLSVIGEDSKIGSKADLKNCHLHNSVILNNETSRKNAVITSKQEGNACEKISEKAYVRSTSIKDVDSDDGPEEVMWLVDPNDVSDNETEASSDSDLDDSPPPSPVADDCTLFYAEVVDSLQRGYEEKLPCSNLILEVNSSRYAYNVTLNEVTMLMCKAVFSLPSRLKCPAKPLIHYFKPLFANYVKTNEGQLECLTAFEEMHEELGNEINTCLHYLYDADVLSEEQIIEWHSGLDDDTLKLKLSKFVTWLEEAAEESDDSEE